MVAELTRSLKEEVVTQKEVGLSDIPERRGVTKYSTGKGAEGKLFL